MHENKVTTISTITLLLLKELRLERNMHQANLADICDKTPSAWNKIEAGKSPLTMEVFFRICQAFPVSPSYVLATAERYASLFSQEGWGIMSKQLDFNDDLLLKEAHEYYSSSGFRARHPRQNWNMNVSILNGPFYNQNGTIEISEVFQFALDSKFKISQTSFNLTQNY